MSNTIEFVTLCADKQRLLNQLRDWEFIPRDGEYKCPKCSQSLKLYNCSRSPDGWLWTCQNYVTHNKKKRQLCGTQVSFRTGTFFERSQLSIFQILSFVDLWVHGASLKLISRLLSMDKRTCVVWASFSREVLVEAFLLDEFNQPLGGPGKTVEIDESQFGKRKYHRGKPVNGTWVFGAYERESGRVFMSTITDRSAATLIPIIQKWVLPGTVVISDCWEAYDGLRDIYNHLKVNHSLTFKDPVSGAHTNGIESSWRAAKAVISSSGRRVSHLPGNLAHYMFNKRCDLLKLDRTAEFFKNAVKVYNPLKPSAGLSNEDIDSYHEDSSDES